MYITGSRFAKIKNLGHLLRNIALLKVKQNPEPNAKQKKLVRLS
jgi:hypothetical protein